MYIYGIHSNSQTQFSVSTWMSNYYFYFIELREQLILGLSKHPIKEKLREDPFLLLILLYGSMGFFYTYFINLKESRNDFESQV